MIKGPEWYDLIYLTQIIGKQQPMNLIKNWVKHCAPHIVGSVLDLGCGLGLLADKTDGVYIGVDFSPIAVRYAQMKVKNQNAAFEIADIHAYAKKTADNAFDTVVLCEVLEHLEYPSDIIREAKRIAKCKIVITVPMDSPNPGHTKSIWTKEDLRRLIGPLELIEDIRGFWLAVWQKNGRRTEALKKKVEDDIEARDVSKDVSSFSDV